VVQADHAEYARMSAADLPGVRVVLDGRDVLDPELWQGVTVVALGRGGRYRS
jgi:UDP-N-acetyl-D-glucosamine dehydrogenase